LIDVNDVHQGYATEDVQLTPEEMKVFLSVGGNDLRRERYRFKGYEVLGHAPRSNSHCGQVRCLRGCLNVEGHNFVDVQGNDWRNKIVFEPVLLSCDKPECEVCYRKGYSVREAMKIDSRLSEARKLWGDVEHFMCSVPLEEYMLSPEQLWDKLFAYLPELGCVGGCAMFHPARFEGGVHYAPHFHVLGVFSGAYRCRGCEKSEAECRECWGFEHKKFEVNRRSGWIFKVFDKRKSVFGTAVYQLSHAAFKIDSKRHNVVRWFGVCSYRKLKVKAKRFKRGCPLCGDEFGRIVSCQGLADAVRCKVHEFECKRKLRVDDFLDSKGHPRYFEAVGGSGE